MSHYTRAPLGAIAAGVLCAFGPAPNLQEGPTSMTRYTVWHETARHDGDAGFDDLATAENEFDYQCARANVARVELLDNIDPDNPIVLKEYDARRQDQNA